MGLFLVADHLDLRAFTPFLFTLVLQLSGRKAAIDYITSLPSPCVNDSVVLSILILTANMPLRLLYWIG